MSNNNNPSSQPNKKKAKTATDSMIMPPSSSSATISKLQHLLTDLNEPPLPLSFVARLSAFPTSSSSSSSSSSKTPNDDQKTTAEIEAASQNTNTLLSALFENHIGPFDDVLNNMIKIYDYTLQDEITAEESNGWISHNEAAKERYNCPFEPSIRGSKPNLLTFTKLLFGKDATKGIDDAIRIDTLNDINSNLVPFRNKRIVTFEYKVGVLVNVLSHLRNLAEEEEKEKTEDDGNDNDDDKEADKECFIPDNMSKHEYLLRFCATYGLSGAMSDVLSGKYTSAPPPPNFSIDTPLPMVDTYKNSEGILSMFSHDCIYHVPAYWIGAVLGYTNIVKTALLKLNGNAHAPFYYTTQRGETIKPNFPSSFSIAHVLLWVIYNNDVNMVRCLIQDCNVQFRWLNDDYFKMLRHLLFRFEEYKNGNYTGDIDSRTSLMFESSRKRTWMRCHASWKEKEGMLKVLIECGLPRELLIPTLDFTLHRELLEKYGEEEEPSEEDQARFEESQRAMSKKERSFLGWIHEACADFNHVQPREGTSDEYDSSGDYDDDEEEDDDDDDDDSEDDDEKESGKKKKKLTKEANTLHVPDYYDRLVNLWKDQTNAQEIKLDEFEEYDPRWVKQRKAEERAARGEAEDENEDEEEEEEEEEYY